MKIDLFGHHCYVPGPMVKVWLQDEIMVNVLIECLALPGKLTHTKKDPLDKKVKAIENHINHLVGLEASGWYGARPADVVVASLFRSRAKLPKAVGTMFFYAVKHEDDTLAAAVGWLKKQGMSVYVEVGIGNSRLDVIGVKGGGLLSSSRIVGIELKNQLSEFKRGFDQMSTCAGYVNEMYLGCTPFMALEFLEKHANARSVRNWDTHELESKLAQGGFGMLLIKGEEAHSIHAPKRRAPERRKLEELYATLKMKQPL